MVAREVIFRLGEGCIIFLSLLILFDFELLCWVFDLFL